MFLVNNSNMESVLSPRGRGILFSQVPPMPLKVCKKLGCVETYHLCLNIIMYVWISAASFLIAVTESASKGKGFILTQFQFVIERKV